jgi:ComF family protein
MPAPIDHVPRRALQDHEALGHAPPDLFVKPRRRLAHQAHRVARKRRGIERARRVACVLIRNGLHAPKLGGIDSGIGHHGQYIEPMLAGALALLPSQCELCRGWGAGLVCRSCTERHAPERPRCARCGLVLGAPAPACGECLRDPPPFEHTVCALDYGFPWDRLITAFKFQRRVELAAPLAEVLSRAIDREDAAPRGNLLVAPVPLTPARLAKRGFNQAWELARRVARARGLQAHAHALRRVLDTSPQAGLSSHERRHNLRNAFAPSPGTTLKGAHVALVDDVMTTGATAREAALALRRGGALSVRLWVLARTPEPA